MWIIMKANKKPLTFSNGKTMTYNTKREALQDIKLGKETGIYGEYLEKKEDG